MSIFFKTRNECLLINATPHKLALLTNTTRMSTYPNLTLWLFGYPLLPCIEGSLYIKFLEMKTLKIETLQFNVMIMCTMKGKIKKKGYLVARNSVIQGQNSFFKLNVIMILRWKRERCTIDTTSARQWRSKRTYKAKNMMNQVCRDIHRV